MAEKTLQVVLVPRADIEANFIAGNPVLLAGELAISLDKNGAFKVGDGVNGWNDLSYNVALTAVSATTAGSATTAVSATTADTATSAGKATNDKNGKDITSYIAGISYSGHTLSVTDGAGNSSSFTTADTTYSNMGGASESTDGTSGLVPAPSSGDQNKFLNGAGQWATPPDTTYREATDSYSGTTKLYANEGANTDGAITQAAITTLLGGKANATHTHGNSDITSLDASKITTGTIDIARLPAGALERLIVVADDVARFALTTAIAQTGDTVKVTATNTMYFIVDDTKLDDPDGYEEYVTGTVDWSAINNKPSTYTPSSHTHSNTEVTGLANLLTGTQGYFLMSNGTSAPTWTNVLDGGVEGASL